MSLMDMSFPSATTAQRPGGRFWLNQWKSATVTPEALTSMERPMATKTLDEHIEVSPAVAGGKPRIAGHRITVQDIAIWHERIGMSADEISSGFDLPLADVYAALAYYFDHRPEIDRDIEEGQSFVELLQRIVP